MPTDDGQSFEDLKTRLDEIVSLVSDDSLPLDEALDLYEEAVGIGLAASRIMESAVEETRRQDNAAEERTSTYDNDTDAQAARTLEAAKRTLQEQADRELEHLKTSTERSLKHMDAYYKEHKDALCDKIYHKIIRM